MSKRLKINLEFNGEQIPIESVNLEKFKDNPVILKQHDWMDLPIGRMRNIKKNERGIFGMGEFHNMTRDSKMISQLHKQGVIRLVNPGGYIERDENGNITKFDIFEVSICF